MNRTFRLPFLPFAALALSLAFIATPAALGGETIQVAGVRHDNAELADLCREGLIYRLASGDYVTLPWAEASSGQISGARSKMPSAFDNALYDAHYVKGTVFQPTPSGLVIQIDLKDDPPGSGYRNGARIVESGLVIVKDFPTNIPQGEGAPVEIVAHKRGTHTFDLAIAAKEIPLLTVAKPLWAMEQEWKNTEGQVIHARVVAVKDGKVMLEKRGQRFVYEVDKLDEDARKRIAEIAEKLEGFPTL
jgi:hypothetical protein